MAETSSGEQRALRWCLESTDDGGKSLERVTIPSLPFRIGRLEELDLTLPFHSVSKRHAEIYLDGDDLMLRDLGSTNGTFVNRKQVTSALLQEGDILHFAEFEFRLGRQRSGEERHDDDETAERGTLALGRLELSRQFVGGGRELVELLDKSMATAVFQPIVSLYDHNVMAYEVLGRGLHENLPANPTELFRVAEAAGREVELSQLFRKKAIEIVRETRRDLPLLFLNTHPSEIGDDELVDSLRQVRDIDPDTPLALEIHEDALGDPRLLAELREHLTKLDIFLALDDFGLGERFLQLAEVPPDYLKFDISLVKDIVKAPPSKRRLLAMLMAAAKEVNAKPIAEGIEKEHEAEVCGTVGFDLAQGYLFSKPLTVEQLEIIGEETIDEASGIG